MLKELIFLNRFSVPLLPKPLQALQSSDPELDENLFQHISPLGWEHINLTGDYVWQQRQFEQGKFRPLRKFEKA